MTIEDVLSTYSLLAETGVNKRMSGILAKFAITREGEALVFRAAEASSEYLEIFMLPVIKKSVAEKFRNGSIRPEDALFSGRYTLEKQDTTKGISSIFLTQNLKESPSNLYNRIVLRYYPDTVSLESSQDTLNLVIPERT